MPHARVAMEAGVHSIWINEQLQKLGHEVIVANVRELQAISHSDRKSDTVDAEKIARCARLDPKILRPISHRTVAQQEAPSQKLLFFFASEPIGHGRFNTFNGFHRKFCCPSSSGRGLDTLNSAVIRSSHSYGKGFSFAVVSALSTATRRAY